QLPAASRVSIQADRLLDRQASARRRVLPQALTRLGIRTFTDSCLFSDSLPRTRSGPAEAWMRIGAACGIVLAAAGVRLGAQWFKAYQNYDFVPGEQILFEDDFSTDTDGEFAAHWKLQAGQGAVNKMNGQTVLAMTDGNYYKVAPRIKTAKYLPDAFTL